jgi:hypothetical protein
MWLFNHFVLWEDLSDLKISCDTRLDDPIPLKNFSQAWAGVVF